MSKIYIGIDPGLSKTGLAAIDEQDRILHTSLVLVSPTPKQKKMLNLDKRWKLVNYKLQKIYECVNTTLDGIIKDNGVSAEDVVVTLEAFNYRTPAAGARKMVNYIYETIAGITMTKCVLISMGIKWNEIPPSQIKRVITLFALGTAITKASKEDIQDGIRILLDRQAVNDELDKYAKSYQEHVGDAIAICKATKHFEEYQRYMKLSPKKRKEWKNPLETHTS